MKCARACICVLGSVFLNLCFWICVPMSPLLPGHTCFVTVELDKCVICVHVCSMILCIISQLHGISYSLEIQREFGWSCVEPSRSIPSATWGILGILNQTTVLSPPLRKSCPLHTIKFSFRVLKMNFIPGLVS